MMLPSERTLPFKSDEAYNGFAEVNGMLHVEHDHLLLEFEVKDAFVGMLKSSAKELRIEYPELLGATYQRSWVKSRLQLKVKRMQVQARFPGAKEGVIELKIKRKYKTVAEDLESYINLRIAEKGLEELI